MVRSVSPRPAGDVHPFEWRAVGVQELRAIAQRLDGREVRPGWIKTPQVAIRGDLVFVSGGLLESRTQFDELWGVAQQVVHLGAEMPEWPFVATSGYLDYFDADWTRDDHFGECLEVIAQEHGDTVVAMVLVDNWPSVYVDFVERTARWPALTVATELVPSAYSALIGRYAQGGEVDITYNFRRAIFFGQALQWVVWVDFIGEAGIVFSQMPARPWRSVISFADSLIDLLPVRVVAEREAEALLRYKQLLVENIESRNLSNDSKFSRE